jgi:hypothetical protein
LENLPFFMTNQARIKYLPQRSHVGRTW